MPRMYREIVWEDEEKYSPPPPPPVLLFLAEPESRDYHDQYYIFGTGFRYGDFNGYVPIAPGTGYHTTMRPHNMDTLIFQE